MKTLAYSQIVHVPPEKMYDENCLFLSDLRAGLIKSSCRWNCKEVILDIISEVDGLVDN